MNNDEKTDQGHAPMSNRRGLEGMSDTFKDSFKPGDNSLQKRIRVILNPAAGQDEPALKIFNRVFHDAGYEWDIRITQAAGDGTRLAKEAVDEGVNVVAVYGGDGSVMEVAAGLIGSSVPMAIIPGGTGNVISIELGIPKDTETACAAIVAENRSVRPIDVGKTNDTCFMLRTGVGLEATVTESADRQAKDKYGIFAYIISTFQALSEPDITRYHLTIDGEEIDSEGLSCVVANSGSLGVAGLALSPDVNVTDGMLDIFVIRKADLTSLFSLASSIIGGSEHHDNMPHWRGKEIQIVTDKPQGVQADGELIGETPVHVQVLPGAVQVIIPPESPVSGKPETTGQTVKEEKATGA